MSAKILLVDDSPTNLDVLRKTLEPEGHNISVALTGEIALKMISRVVPDLILLDITMPGIDGFEVLRLVKNNEFIKGIPIILVSAKNQLDEILKGFKLGAADYITKPFHQEELLARVRTHLEIQYLAKQKKLLIVELKNKNHKLKELDKLKNKFLSIAAHDLRNPIASIGGYSELLLDEKKNFSKDQSEFLSIIHNISQEMLTLVNDLLDVSVIESGKLELNCKRDNLIALLNDRIRILGVQAKKKDIKFHKDFCELGEVYFDRSRIAQVIDNLISNAIKFSPTGSNIYLGLSLESQYAKISIQDEGPGIPTDERPKLFKKFQRLSARPTGGEKSTGLGLAIVKKIVEEHQGKLDVKSKVGSGSIFSFTLPLHR